MNELSQFLDDVEKRYHRSQFLSSDPLEFVHRFQNPWDQEAVGLLSALLAYGNVRQIRKSIQEALDRIAQLADSPQEFVKSLKSRKFQTQAHLVFRGYVHRFNVGRDLVWLFELLSKSWLKYGSLGGHFLSKLDAKDETIENALNQLINDWRDWQNLNPTHHQKTSFSYLLTSPQDGSCCKRWCMLLRWMGRKDELDLGLWMSSSPLKGTFPKGRSLASHQLVMPLDTHTGRLSQSLELTLRKSLNWKAALEVTRSLKLLDPRDPIRYDFSLARIGIVQKKSKIRP